MNEQQAEQMRHGAGFIAALDQSGGSTPKALAAYGVGPERYASEAEMFDLVHAMRTRVITSPSFTSNLTWIESPSKELLRWLITMPFAMS